MSIDNKNALKELKIHEESFLMYEKTKKETIERMSEAMNPDGSKKFTQEDIDEKLKLINEMQGDIIELYVASGGNIEDLKKLSVKEKKDIKQIKVTPKKNITSKEENTEVKIKTQKRKPIVKKEVEENEETETFNDSTTKKNKKSIVSRFKDDETTILPENWNGMNITESFDVIPLPSKGECYDNGMSSIAVSYLTANDENMIVSPNLYHDGLILDYLLKTKIKNNDINPDDLLVGDAETIILWLRATGYGTNYPITVTDTKTGINFDAVADLTQIKHKPFVLKGDKNGCFDYILPISKDEIKFRFLTRGDIKQIENIEKDEQVNIKKDRLNHIVEELNSYLELEDILNKDEKIKLFEAKRNIKKWAEKIEADEETPYTHKLTNRLELSIVSINGNYDREYISEYVQNMNVRDALSLRRYITENEPGLDYTITVERPESLGGGSMSVFLSLDEYVFLNISE